MSDTWDSTALGLTAWGFSGLFFFLLSKEKRSVIINSKKMPHAFQTERRHDTIGQKSLQWIGIWPQFLFLYHKQKQSNNRKIQTWKTYSVFIFGRGMLIDYKQFFRQKKCIMNLSIPRKGFPFSAWAISLTWAMMKLNQWEETTSFIPTAPASLYWTLRLLWLLTLQDLRTLAGLHDHYHN